MNSTASNKRKKQILWLSWDLLYDGKFCGSFGFRDLHRFNLALSAKLGWRLLINCLWAKVIKSLYFSNGEFLSAKARSKASWSWKCILAGREILCKDLRKQVGDGCYTRIWEDHWLLSLPSYKICSLKPEHSTLDQVANLKHEHCWNDKFLNELFSPYDITMIKNIQVREKNRVRKDGCECSQVEEFSLCKICIPCPRK